MSKEDMLKALYRLIGVAIFVALGALLFLAPAAATARSGALDTGFGEGGRVALDGLGAPFLMDVSPDGSVTILSRDSVNRFLADGQPDPGFGEGGRAPFDPMIDGLPLDPSSIAVDNQGRVVVFGTASDPTQTQFIGGEAEAVPEIWAVVVRLGTDGRLDISFGEGKGFVRSDFGLRSAVPELPKSFPTVASLAGDVDSQDRPVLLIGVSNPYAPCSGHSLIEPTPKAILRLTPSGSLDPSFAGGDGISPMKGYPTPAPSELRVVSGDQPLAVVGGHGGCAGPVAFRLSADGIPLFGSGGDGTLYRELGFGAIDPSGALLLMAGRPTSEVIRIAPNGHRDRRFGRNGSASVTMPNGVQRTLRPIGLDAQGRVVLAGSFVLPPKRSGAKADQKQRSPRRGYFFAMRLLASGKPDLSFGNRGRIATPIGENRRALVDQAALDAQGRLVVLLTVLAGGSVTENVLVRYLMGS